MYRKVELLFAASPMLVGLASIFGAYYTIALPATAYGYDPVGPRGFAYFVGTALVILGAILLAMTVTEQRAKGGIGVRTDRDPDDAGDDMRYPASSFRAVAMMALTLAFALVINPIGYIAASVLLIVAGLVVMGSRAWRMIVIFSVAYAASTYLLFHTVLGVRLPAGAIETLLKTIGI